jgi:glycosyltransferase involved in cell wall biosynthesis
MKDTDQIHTPAVSIIMNCYNSEKYLKEAIDSVYAQTYKDWEIIFWDNGSSDGSAAIAKHYDKKIKYYRTEQNVYLGEARTKAIGKASGRYIAFLDCDDIWLHEKLMKQVALLETDPSIDFIHSNCYTLNMDTGGKKLMYSEPQPQGYIFKYQLSCYRISLLTAIVRKTAFDRLDSLFDENLQYGEEMDVFLRLFYKSKTYYMNEPLAIYRVHPSMSSIVLGFELILNETDYIINKLTKMDKDFSRMYSKEIAFVNSNTAFMRMKVLLNKLEIEKARAEIRPYRLYKPQYFIYYLSTYAGKRLWSLLLNIRRSVH